MTTSIIVYRNPLEQAFWEGLMNSEIIFPIMVAAALSLAAIMITARLLDSRSLRKFLPRTYGPIDTYLPLAMGVATAVITLWIML